MKGIKLNGVNSKHPPNFSGDCFARDKPSNEDIAIPTARSAANSTLEKSPGTKACGGILKAENNVP